MKPAAVLPASCGAALALLLTVTAAHAGSQLSFAQLCRKQFDAALQVSRVEFRLSSSELKPSALPLLDALVEILADCPKARLSITGHSDASGNAAANLALSAARADAVARYLGDRGIDQERLATAGAGATQRLDTSGTPAARKRNRRIEFELTFGP